MCVTVISTYFLRVSGYLKRDSLTTLFYLFCLITSQKTLFIRVEMLQLLNTLTVVSSKHAAVRTANGNITKQNTLRLGQRTMNHTTLFRCCERLDNIYTVNSGQLPKVCSYSTVFIFKLHIKLSKMLKSSSEHKCIPDMC